MNFRNCGGYGLERAPTKAGVTVSLSNPYIDPGSGALLWQILVVTALSLPFYVRSTIKRIQGVFRKLKK
jgi:hypothetical protein